MKIWEAIQMLEQMDHTKECTVTFGTEKQTKVPHMPYPQRDYVIGRADWLNRTHGIEQGLKAH